jgi:hypothetical protein
MAKVLRSVRMPMLCGITEALASSTVLLDETQLKAPSAGNVCSLHPSAENRTCGKPIGHRTEA